MNTKVKFVAVGLVNTAFSTIAFFVIDRLVNPGGRGLFLATVALVLSLLLATPFAYFMQRRFVFITGKSASWTEFARFATVASGMYALNVVLLPALVFVLNHVHEGDFDILGFGVGHSFIGQGILTLILPFISWTSHSRFSFQVR